MAKRNYYASELEQRCWVTIKEFIILFYFALLSRIDHPCTTLYFKRSQLCPPILINKVKRQMKLGIFKQLTLFKTTKKLRKSENHFLQFVNEMGGKDPVHCKESIFALYSPKL